VPEEVSQSEAASGARGRGRRPLRSEIRIGAVVAIAVAIGLIVWLVVGRGGSNNSTASSTNSAGPSTAKAGAAQYIGPVVESQKQIADYAKKIGQSIYWAGPQKGYTYELTRTANGNAYVRYLPKGAKAGAPGGNYTIVVTYPFNNSYEVLKKVSGNDVIKVPGGGVAVVAGGYPRSVRMSFPGVNYQIEVYTPSPARSIALALSGNIKPVS
jgi:hypothetical protein